MEKNIITQLQNEVTRLAKANGTDVVGFASADRFEKDDPIFKIMPETKTVIGLGFRILRGIYRGIEEGSTYYQYTTMAVENMEETVMPMAQMRISMMLEENDFIALPQRRHQQIMAEHDSTNPEVAYDAVYRDKTAETQMDFVNAAVKCGLGEKGFDGTILNDDFGPMFRYCFILTDAEFEPTDEYVPHLCDNCGKCAEACPEGAITQNAKGVYMINKKKCTGCGKCAEACPFGLIVKTEGNPASKCIACGICAKACPMDVLEVVEE